MLIRTRDLFDTKLGKGIFCVHDTLIDPAIAKCTEIECPVRLGGTELIAVKK